MQLLWSSVSMICWLLVQAWQCLDEILPLLVLIVTVLAVYIAWHAKCETRITAQMNLFYQHMARYSAIETHNALGIIGKLSETRNQEEGVFLEVVEKFHNKENIHHVNRRKAGKPHSVCVLQLQYKDINEARRQVSHFFTFSFELFADFGVLDAVYFEKICRLDTFKFVYHVVEWLELALNPEYARETFTGLLEQSGRNDIEDLRKLRPPETWGEVERMIQASLAE